MISNVSNVNTLKTLIRQPGTDDFWLKYFKFQTLKAPQSPAERPHPPCEINSNVTRLMRYVANQRVLFNIGYQASFFKFLIFSLTKTKNNYQFGKWPRSEAPGSCAKLIQNNLNIHLRFSFGKGLRPLTGPDSVFWRREDSLWKNWDRTDGCLS